jgi:alkanesulfonate monooxygenase SsuD/methylene tetrahydromethanopterin reductase-like flavin-dependent oxidoreductase (luciferase family)
MRIGYDPANLDQTCFNKLKEPITMPMQFGLMMRNGNHRCPGAGRFVRFEELKDLARAGEAAGFSTLFAPDHLLFRGRPPMVAEGETCGLWEAWTLLTGLAGVTERITIGPFVVCTAFRNPALLAKMADTFDEVSGGRLILGLGAGWHKPEFDAFGYSFDKLVSQFDEAMQVIYPLLRTGHVDFKGQYYEARDCELLPRGPRGNDIPIMIGAHGPRMMRLVAKYADEYNTVTHADPAEVAEPFAMLDAACDEVGRDRSAVLKTAGCFLMQEGSNQDPGGLPEKYIGGSEDQIVETMLGFHAAGVRHMTCFLSPWNTKGVERFGRVIERVQKATA